MKIKGVSKLLTGNENSECTLRVCFTQVVLFIYLFSITPPPPPCFLPIVHPQAISSPDKGHTLSHSHDVQ